MSYTAPTLAEIAQGYADLGASDGAKGKECGVYRCGSSYLLIDEAEHRIIGDLNAEAYLAAYRAAREVEPS